MSKVISIELDGYEDVYNMEVENHHNFSVNGGFIVHNCDAIRYFLSGRPCNAETIKTKLPKDIPPDLRADLEADPKAMAHWIKENGVV